MLKEELLKLVDKNKKKLAKSFAEELIIGSNAYYQSKGVRNTKFKNSTLIKTLKVVVVSDELQVIAKDYIEYLDKGRKPFTKKVPITAILKWLRKVGLPANNKTAYRIQTSIYKKGLRGRNFLDKAFKDLNKNIDILAEQALDKTLEKL